VIKKAELIAQVTTDTDLSKDAAEKAVEATFRHIERVLLKQSAVRIAGIGKFVQREAAAVRKLRGGVEAQVPVLRMTIERSRSVEERLALKKSAFDPDPRARALLRGARLSAQDLRAAGGTYELADVQELLGISRQAVEKRVRNGSLLAVPGPGNRRRYPVVQFGRNGSVVEGLREISAALPTRSPWAFLNFLVNPDPLLQRRRPIDLLKEGKIELVVESARRTDEQGA
jgi:nucleoid DNA-binding protein